MEVVLIVKDDYVEVVDNVDVEVVDNVDVELAGVKVNIDVVEVDIAKLLICIVVADSDSDT